MIAEHMLLCCHEAVQCCAHKLSEAEADAFFFFLLVAFQRDRGYAFNASNKERERESDATSPPLFSLSRQTKKREEKMPI